MCLVSAFPSERGPDGFSLGFSSPTTGNHPSAHLIPWKALGLAKRGGVEQQTPAGGLSDNIKSTKQASQSAEEETGGQGVWPLVKIPTAWEVLLSPEEQELGCEYVK